MASHLGFPIRTILAIFDLKVTAMLPTKFKINKPFDSEEEAKNRFSRWQTSWISDQKDFSYFLPISQPDTSYQVSSQLAFSVLEKKRKIDFQDGRQGGHLGFLIRTILVISDLQIITMLPTKFRVNWPFSSKEEAIFKMAASLDIRSAQF